jgi:hypothetical protein
VRTSGEARDQTRFLFPAQPSTARDGSSCNVTCLTKIDPKGSFPNAPIIGTTTTIDWTKGWPSPKTMAPYFDSFANPAYDQNARNLSITDTRFVSGWIQCGAIGVTRFDGGGESSASAFLGFSDPPVP